MPTDLEIIEQLGRKIGACFEESRVPVWTLSREARYELDDRHQVVKLQLSNYQLGEFPKEIMHLQNLTALDLSGNQIGEFPKEIMHLQHLTALDLSGNQIGEFPEEITHLQNLTALDLSGNQIGEFPKEIKNLQNLTLLGLSGNQLGEFPKEIKNLQNLIALDLSGNQISELPKEVNHLQSLTTLYLYNNRLSELPEEINQLQNLTSLNLEGNPLTQMPPEIVEQGIEAIFEYLRQLPNDASGTEHSEAKMILMGQGEVGKTCLANRLKTGKFIKEERTSGVNILEWDINAPTEEKEDVRLNVWDFGGQEIYHATHQFFLTKRSLYVVVWNARKSSLDFDNIYYWLHTVEAFGQDSPVLLVMTKLNEWDDDLNMKDIKDRFPNVVELYKVDSEDGRGIAELKEAIQRVSWGLPHMRTTWIDAWYNVREKLENDPRNWITHSEFHEVCDKEGLSDRQTNILDEYLHDLGIIIHFNSLNLQNMVILKPNWATRAVYRVLDTDSVKKREGILLQSELSEIWDEKEYPSAIHSNLLELMNEFELAYQLQDKSYLVVDLLPSTEPEFPWDFSDNLRFDYTYDFMPPGVMTRFIVRAHEDLEIKNNGLPLCWREGAVLWGNNARAFVKSRPIEKKIEIRISGNDATKREMLAIIRDHFDHINGRIEKVKIAKKIPCNCSTGCSNTWEYDDLLRLESKGVDELTCTKTGQKISISILLEGYQRKNERHISDEHFVIENNVEVNPVIEVKPDIDTIIEQPKQEVSKKSPWYQRIWIVTAGLIALVATILTITWTTIQMTD